MNTPLSADQKIRLTVLVTDFSAAAHVAGAVVETRARTFELPSDIAAYIARNRGTYSTIAFALEDVPNG